MSSALFHNQTSSGFFTEEELAQVDQQRCPEHVAIIMDGNRRWAKMRKLPIMAGHLEGAKRLSQIARAAGELGIKVLTVFAFSTENWKRSSLEIKALMHLFKTQLLAQKKIMIQEGVRLHTIGDLTKIPKDIQKVLVETIEATKNGQKFDLVIGLNYGGRDELKRAVCSIIEDCLEKKIQREEISEDLIASYLDTAKWRDPDLLIRTSGESRISNFLLWQISYAEVLVTDVLWPDFSKKNLLSAILEYQKREARLGK